MGDDEIDLTEFGNITISGYDNNSITLSGTADYEDWLMNNIGTIDIGNDWTYSTDPLLTKNNITLTGGGEEMLRVAEDGFYVRGVKIKQGKREAKAVYEAFKRWMTHAIMSGELNDQ
jgi:hypothetical protein